ncbi:hypothetical protein ACFYSC_28500 [Streptosporangium sp. NPDC004379]
MRREPTLTRVRSPAAPLDDALAIPARRKTRREYVNRVTALGTPA